MTRHFTAKVHLVISMPISFLFALIGLMAGGVRGLFIGFVIGYLASWMLKSVLVKKLASVQTQFLESTFAVMGALCKADGVVTRDEIAIAESMFDRLHLSGQQREQAKAAFNRGKSPGFDLDAEVRAFARVAHGQRPLLVMFLQIQCSAIAGDGNVHPAEHQLLLRVARLLGLSEADVAQLEALLRTGAAARVSMAPHAQRSLVWMMLTLRWDCPRRPAMPK